MTPKGANPAASVVEEHAIWAAEAGNKAVIKAGAAGLERGNLAPLTHCQRSARFRRTIVKVFDVPEVRRGLKVLC